MKILGIEIHNLNSLKGTFVLRFDESPLSDAGIFAITGNTGSGKSTILDAITLALYRQTPRLGGGVAVEDIITKHQNEAWAMVEFENRGEAYRVKYAYKRKRKNLDRTWELSLLKTGEILSGNKLAETEKMILEITGLPYQQFLKSVLLSQGETTKFLQADANERSELLEKITEDYQYSQISVFVFQHHKKCKEILQETSLRLEALKMLSTEEIQSKRHVLDEYKTVLKNFESQSAIFDIQLKWFEDFQKNEKEKVFFQNRNSELFEKLTQHKDDFQKIVNHEKILPFLPKLKELNKEEKEIQLLQIKLDQTENLLKDLTEKFSVLESELKINQEKWMLISKQFEENLTLIAKVEPLDWQISQTEKELFSLNVEQKKLENDFKKSNENLELLSQKLVQLTQNEKVAEEWLVNHKIWKNSERKVSNYKWLSDEYLQINQNIKNLKNSEKLNDKQLNDIVLSSKEFDRLLVSTNEKLQNIQSEISEAKIVLNTILDGKSPAFYRDEYLQLPEKLEVLNVLIKDVERYENQRDKLKSLKADNLKISEEFTVLEKILGNCSSNLNAEIIHLEALEKIVKQNQLLKKYETDRLDLVDGLPCPLCGSVHHPLRDEVVENDVVNDDKNWRLQAEKVGNLKEFIADYEKQLVVLNLKITSGNSAELEETKFLHALETNFKSNEYGFEINQLQDIQQKLEELRSNQLSLKQKIDGFEKQEKLIRELEIQFQELNVLKAEAETKWNEFQKNEAVLLEKKQSILVALDENVSKIERLEVDLTELLKEFGLNFELEKSTEIYNLLETESNRYKKAEDKLETIKQNILVISSDKKNMTENVEIQKNALADKKAKYLEIFKKQNENKALRLNLFGEKNTETEKKYWQDKLNDSENFKQKSEANLQENIQTTKHFNSQKEDFNLEIKSRKDSFLLSQEKFNMSLRENGILSKEELNAAELDQNFYESLKKELRQLEDEKLAVETSLHQLQNNDEKLLSQKNENSAWNWDYQTILQENIQLKNSINETHRNIGGLENELRQNDLALENHASLQTLYQTQKDEANRWGNLDQLIGSKDGKLFRNFAQGITLNVLVQLANKHLQNFSDRYLIHKTEGKDLEIEIVDKFQADVIRPVKTLSGGESFLVSLALALGLSDLSGNKTEISTLFIDEGFGTLDPESLEIALDALESLQSSNKSIGIISHVGLLQERISTQIQLKKLSGGYSEMLIKA